MRYVMIDKATALETVLRKLKKLPVGHVIDLRTYKRNRSVVIKHMAQGTFDVVEHGFHEERFQVTLPKMKKLLKSLIKREFPRSTKIRLYDLGEAKIDAHITRKNMMLQLPPHTAHTPGHDPQPTTESALR